MQQTAKTVITKTPKRANDVSLKWKCSENSALCEWAVRDLLANNVDFFVVVSIKVHHNFFFISLPLFPKIQSICSYCWSVSFNNEQKKVKFQFGFVDISLFFKRLIHICLHVIHYYFTGQMCGSTCAYIVWSRTHKADSISFVELYYKLFQVFCILQRANVAWHGIFDVLYPRSIINKLLLITLDWVLTLGLCFNIEIGDWLTWPQVSWEKRRKIKWNKIKPRATATQKLPVFMSSAYFQSDYFSFSISFA